jgi:cystathionine beta-lyase/cystathionine gamma-synthase
LTGNTDISEYLDLMDFTEILYLLGENQIVDTRNPVSTPILQTSNFSYSSFEQLKDALHDEYNNPLYSRGHNPTVRVLEEKLAALQGTESALCFGSGSAAIAATVITHLRSGDHVICVKHCYSWTQKLLSITLKPYGIEVDYVDDLTEEILSSVKKDSTKMIILESPTSLNFHVPDIFLGIKYAKRFGWISVVDNSYGSPLNNKVATLQPDYIAHSATKFISGHSDVVAGVVCGSKERIKEVFYNGYMTFGASLSPFDAWLLIRGLRTLPLRLEKSAHTADLISKFLTQHPKVSAVHDPFSPTFPLLKRTKEQMDHRISMFSFELKSTSEKSVESFCNHLKIIRIAVSWGGYESLALPALALPNSSHAKNLIRLYIGLESFESLKSDLSTALEAIN